MVEEEAGVVEEAAVVAEEAAGEAEETAEGVAVPPEADATTPELLLIAEFVFTYLLLWTLTNYYIIYVN